MPVAAALDWQAGEVAIPPGVRFVRCAQLTPRAPYAYAAVAEEVSRLAFTAGACPLDEDGATVAVGDVTGQAEQVMANLRTALRPLAPTSPTWSRQRCTWPPSARRICTPHGRSSEATSGITTFPAPCWE